MSKVLKKESISSRAPDVSQVPPSEMTQVSFYTDNIDSTSWADSCKLFASIWDGCLLRMTVVVFEQSGTLNPSLVNFSKRGPTLAEKCDQKSFFVCHRCSLLFLNDRALIILCCIHVQAAKSLNSSWKNWRFHAGAVCFSHRLIQNFGTECGAGQS